METTWNTQLLYKQPQKNTNGSCTLTCNLAILLGVLHSKLDMQHTLANGKIAQALQA